MVKVIGSLHLGNGILKVKPNKPFFGSNGLELFFIQDDWVSIELAPTPLGCYYLVDFTTDPTNDSFNPTEKWRVPQHDSSLAQVRGVDTGTSKYESEIQQLKEVLQQRSHLHQEQSGKYQAEIQQLKEVLQKRSQFYQQESGKYQSEIQQLKEVLQQRSHLHQEQSGKYQAEIQQLSKQIENLKTKDYTIKSDGGTDLLRSLNNQQISPDQPAYNRNTTEITTLINNLRQKLALKEQQINALQSQLNSSSQVVESLQQRSQFYQQESGKYQSEIQQLKDLIQQRSHFQPSEVEELKAKYNQVVRDLAQANELSQQQRKIHQQELAGLKQKLHQQQSQYEQKLESVKSGKLENLESRSDLLRAFNSSSTGDRTVSQSSGEQASALNELRQKLAMKEQQINALQSQLNSSSQVVESLQQRSRLQQQESGKYQKEIQELQKVVEDRSVLTSRLKDLESKYLQAVEETKKANSDWEQKTYLHQLEVEALRQQIQEQQSQHEELAMQIQQALIDNQDKATKINETESNTSLNIIKRFL